MSDQPEPNWPEGTISVAYAIELTQNWRDYLKKSEQKFIARSFLLPICDFKNILKYNPDAEGVRAYIGLGNLEDPLSAQLILVPVVDGEEVLYMATGDNPGDGEGDDSNIYDVSKACPPYCGLGSPLDE